MTKNSIEEASVDGVQCMAAVHTVVLNRMSSSGMDPISVILFPKAFSWTLDPVKILRTRKDYQPVWDTFIGVTINTLTQWEQDNYYLTNGADHYAHKAWIKAGKVSWVDDPAMFFRMECGSHRFYEYMPEVKPRKRKKVRRIDTREDV